MENFTDYEEWLHLKDYDTNFNTVSDQKEIIVKKKLECYGLIMLDNPSENEGNYCSITWDGISCWPATKAGTVAVKACPDYIKLFDTTQNVTRACDPDGSWHVYPENDNKSWSDYNACSQPELPLTNEVPDLIMHHMEPINIMVNTGYGLSLASLVVAVIIMLYFKKLHCPRNTIHLNLFLSFILRAMISFIKKGTMIENVGFSNDVYYDVDGNVKWLEGGLHWECRLFMTIHNYIIAANFAWIFVEALYLQMLISVAVFTEKKHIHVYMLLGWTFPLTFIIPWAIVRATYANVYCWTTTYRWVQWIIHGPILLTIIINFVIFINIVRVLFTKLNASPCPETKKFRYRRLAKSTLVLIPLFGVYYLVFSILYNITVKYEGIGLVINLYLEMFLTSYQGFFLSLLFCFFNAEVQNEFKKAWKRYTLQRSGSSRWRSTFTSRTKSWKDHGRSETNGVSSRGDKVRPNECEMPSSPTINSIRTPFTQTSYAYDVKSNDMVTVNDIEITEQTPWLNNNHTAYVEQHVPPYQQADERL